MPFDVQNGDIDVELRTFYAGEAITAGNIVYIYWDDTNDRACVKKSHTDYLKYPHKVAYDTAAAGDPIRVVWSGIVTNATCAATEDIVDDTDFWIYAITGGLCAGADRTDLASDDGTIMDNAFARGIGVASGTTSKATILVVDNGSATMIDTDTT